MKSPYISDLQLNQTALGTFTVKAKEMRQKRSGEPYLSLVLGDRSGDMDAKMWENVAGVAETFDRGDFVRVKGVLNVFQNRPQFTVHKIQRIDESEVEPADFFPASARNIDEMAAELAGLIEEIQSPHLKALLKAIFGDARIAQLYRLAPAAKTVHHACLGGLLEHVLSLCAICRFMASHYPDIDRDLLLAGALLHDLGKIDELSYERGFGYTSEGQLLGHITIGLRIVDEKIRALPDFPPKLRTLVEHMLLSHHGHLEFGSPKLPLFAEALLLHYLDDLDSKMDCMRTMVAQDRQVEGDWTGFSQALERSVLKKARYLEEESPAPSPPSVAPPQPPRAPDSPFAEKLMGALASPVEPEGR
jgi:3'-5' exoribonuclease